MKLTSPIAQIFFGFEEMDAAGLCTEADGTISGLTGNTYITVIPIALGPVGTAGTVAFQVAAVRSNLAEIAGGNKSETLTRQLSTTANALMLSLKTNGHSVEDQANALAAGNLVQAKKIILSTGYKLKKERSGGGRTFEVVATGPNWVHYHTNKTKKAPEGQLWRYGITSAKNTPPPAGSLITRFTQVTDVIISDLPSGSIVAMQRAGIFSGTASDEEKAVASLSKTKHPVISHNTIDPYAWTDFIYIVVP